MFDLDQDPDDRGPYPPKFAAVHDGRWEERGDFLEEDITDKQELLLEGSKIHSGRWQARAEFGNDTSPPQSGAAHPQAHKWHDGRWEERAYVAYNERDMKKQHVADHDGRWEDRGRWGHARPGAGAGYEINRPAKDLVDNQTLEIKNFGKYTPDYDDERPALLQSGLHSQRWQDRADWKQKKKPPGANHEGRWEDRAMGINDEGASRAPASRAASAAALSSGAGSSSLASAEGAWEDERSEAEQPAGVRFQAGATRHEYPASEAGPAGGGRAGAAGLHDGRWEARAAYGRREPNLTQAPPPPDLRHPAGHPTHAGEAPAAPRNCWLHGADVAALDQHGRCHSEITRPGRVPDRSRAAWMAPGGGHPHGSTSHPPAEPAAAAPEEGAEDPLRHRRCNTSITRDVSRARRVSPPLRPPHPAETASWREPGTGDRVVVGEEHLREHRRRATDIGTELEHHAGRLTQPDYVDVGIFQPHHNYKKTDILYEDAAPGPVVPVVKPEGGQAPREPPPPPRFCTTVTRPRQGEVWEALLQPSQPLPAHAPVVVAKFVGGGLVQEVLRPPPAPQEGPPGHGSTAGSRAGGTRGGGGASKRPASAPRAPPPSAAGSSQSSGSSTARSAWGSGHAGASKGLGGASSQQSLYGTKRSSSSATSSSGGHTRPDAQHLNTTKRSSSSSRSASSTATSSSGGYTGPGTPDLHGTKQTSNTSRSSSSATSSSGGRSLGQAEPSTQNLNTTKRGLRGGEVRFAPGTRGGSEGSRDEIAKAERAARRAAAEAEAARVKEPGELRGDGKIRYAEDVTGGLATRRKKLEAEVSKIEQAKAERERRRGTLHVRAPGTPPPKQEQYRGFQACVRSDQQQALHSDHQPVAGKAYVPQDSVKDCLTFG